MMSAAPYPVVLFGALRLPRSCRRARRSMRSCACACISRLSVFRDALGSLGAALFHGLVRRDGVLQSMVSVRTRWAMVRDGVGSSNRRGGEVEGAARQCVSRILRVPSMSADCTYSRPVAPTRSCLTSRTTLLRHPRKARMQAVRKIRQSGGSLIFVAATVEHRFHRIEQELEIWFFARPRPNSSPVGFLLRWRYRHHGEGPLAERGASLGSLITT